MYQILKYIIIFLLLYIEKIWISILFFVFLLMSGWWYVLLWWTDAYIISIFPWFWHIAPIEFGWNSWSWESLIYLLANSGFKIAWFFLILISVIETLIRIFSQKKDFNFRHYYLSRTKGEKKWWKCIKYFYLISFIISLTYFQKDFPIPTYGIVFFILAIITAWPVLFGSFLIFYSGYLIEQVYSSNLNSPHN